MNFLLFTDSAGHVTVEGTPPNCTSCGQPVWPTDTHWVVTMDGVRHDRCQGVTL